MKKIVFFIGSLLFASSVMTSCLGDDTKSSATVNYIGMVDSIKYAEPADSVWTFNIKEALQKMEVLYTTFETSDTSYSTINSYAVMGCNEKAANYLNSKLVTVSLDKVKKNIYSLHADSLNKLGYIGSDSIPLKGFTLYSSLWSYYTSGRVCYYEHNIK